MITCVTCKVDKTPEEFKVKSQKCRDCTKAYHNNYYARKQESILARKKISQYQQRVIAQQYVYDYLKANPCACGESDPVALEFDHRDPIDKHMEVSTMVYSHSLESIKKEISKCEVLCANCHRKRTARQFNWYKDINKW